jgi:hypothetical protein
MKSTWVLMGMERGMGQTNFKDSSHKFLSKSFRMPESASLILGTRIFDKSKISNKNELVSI